MDLNIGYRLIKIKLIEEQFQKNNIGDWVILQRIHK